MHPLSINLHYYPELRKLKLTEQEFGCLRAQGFVRAEIHHGKRVFKLRYRLGGRQRVRFLGTDERRAQAVERELLVLQREVQGRRHFTRLRRQTRKHLLESKARLKSLVEANGYHFHGQAVRKRRRPKNQG